MRKTVKVTKETWKKLMQIKIDKDYESLDNVIDDMIKIVEQLELAKKNTINDSVKFKV